MVGKFLFDQAQVTVDAEVKILHRIIKQIHTDREMKRKTR